MEEAAAGGSAGQLDLDAIGAQLAVYLCGLFACHPGALKTTLLPRLKIDVVREGFERDLRVHSPGKEVSPADFDRALARLRGPWADSTPGRPQMMQGLPSDELAVLGRQVDGFLSRIALAFPRSPGPGTIVLPYPHFNITSLREAFEWDLREAERNGTVKACRPGRWSRSPPSPLDFERALALATKGKLIQYANRRIDIPSLTLPKLLHHSQSRSVWHARACMGRAAS
jgi:hypothetical protein